MLLAALCVLGLWLWQAGREHRALLRLPEAQRHRVYQDSLDSFSQLCKQPVAFDLEARCGEQAAFLIELPECDAACRELARPFLTRTPRSR